MRILLDECVNPRLRLAFPGDEVKTVDEMGWRSLTNGRLMKAAAPHFDVFVTLDQNLQFQNPTAPPIVHSSRKFATWPGKPSQVNILQIG